jgi:hypothetical protein
MTAVYELSEKEKSVDSLYAAVHESRKAKLPSTQVKTPAANKKAPQ